MQMPNANPSGLAGLMQKPPGQVPGQQPMPSPNKASPMAGLGSVDDRVSAYQGNTKPLEQRYAMTQDLLDLLALQKIKSQKEAAARQMQLQMAQQGQQDGQANMTVAQQREQEVDALTKNELAAQRGDTAQKQAGDQQAMMQKMMSGVASAPGAAMAAQPKAMAAGGIVGYAGPQGSAVVEDTMGTPNLNQQELANKASEMATGERNRAKIIAELEQKLAFLTNAGAPQAAAVRAQLEAFKASGATSLPKAPPVAVPPAAVPPAPAKLNVERDPATNMPMVSSGPATNMPMVSSGPAKPLAAPKPPGIAGLPGAAAAPPQVQPGVVGPANDFGKKLEAAALKNAEIDPAARQLAEERRITDKTALTPNQRGVFEEGIAGLQGMYKEQYDPERQQREGLKRALIGAGGRRYGEFAGAASAGMAYDDQQRAAKLKEFGDVQKARTGLIDIDRANVKGGIDAGMKAYEQGSLSQRQGLDSGSRMYGDDVKSRDTLYNINVGSRDKALDRVVEKFKVDAQNATTKAVRENLSFERARALYGTLTQRVQKEESELQENFNKGPMGLLLQQDPAKLKPEDRNRLEIAQLELVRQKAAMRKELAPVLESAAKQMGIFNTDLSPADKAVIEKYTKGK